MSYKCLQVRGVIRKTLEAADAEAGVAEDNILPEEHSALPLMEKLKLILQPLDVPRVSDVPRVLNVSY